MVLGVHRVERFADGIKAGCGHGDERGSAEFSSRGLVVVVREWLWRRRGMGRSTNRKGGGSVG